LVQRIKKAVDGLHEAPGDAEAAESNKLVLEIMRACLQLLELKAGGAR
jgi:hypothetical protein